MMRDRYIYKGQDITTDIVMKTEDIVQLIADKEKLPFDDCLELFSATRTCKNLQDTMTQLWAESAEYIVDEYYREINEDR